MKAFILAAGEGTRMRPLTSKTPKPLLPVAGEPILQHILDSLDRLVDEIIILVGWKARRIRDSIDTDKFDFEVKFTKQDRLLGTADAISKAVDFVDDDFICMNGDVILFEEELAQFIEYFEGTDGSVIGMAEVDNPESYGVMKTNGEYVEEIIEKPDEPPTDLVNAGLYGFSPEIFDAIDRTEESPRGEYEITDSLKFLMDDRKLKGFTLEKGRWIELSRPWELLSANKKLLELDKVNKKKKGTIEDGVHIEGWVSIDEGSVIKQGAYIKGPVCIGKNSQVGPNCLVRPCTSIGDNCKIGNAVEVKNSIIMDGTNVPHHNYVGDSVLGRDCNLGSGTKVANLRLDEEEIVLTHRGERINTGRRKLGVIMGDDVKTGINSMINMGTIIGEGSMIGPGALVDGEIGPESRIK